MIKPFKKSQYQIYLRKTNEKIISKTNNNDFRT